MKKNLILLAVCSIILCAVLGCLIDHIVSIMIFIIFWGSFAFVSFGNKFIVNKWKLLRSPSKDNIHEYILYRVNNKELVGEDIEKLSYFEKLSLYKFINHASGINIYKLDENFVKSLNEKLKEIVYSKREYWDELDNNEFAEIWSKLSKENYEHVKTFFFDDKEGFDVLKYFLWLKEKEVKDGLIWPTLSRDENDMLLMWLKRIYPNICIKDDQSSKILNHRGVNFVSHLLLLKHNNSVKAMQLIEHAIASLGIFLKL